MDLRSFRKSLGLSQHELAEMLGISNSHVSHMENGDFTPGLRVALTIESSSDGQVSALSLLSREDADLLRAAIERAGGRVGAEAQPA